jgi:hypothetical protein
VLEYGVGDVLGGDPPRVRRRHRPVELGRAPVAQWTERLPSKQRVGGSSPPRRAEDCAPRDARRHRSCCASGGAQGRTTRRSSTGSATELRVDRTRLVGAVPSRDKAERMTCRIGVDPRAAGPRLIVELRPAQGKHVSFGCIEIVDSKMKVDLHGRRRIGPSRRLMARRALERQVEACILAVAYRVPVCVCIDDRPAREPAVEIRERSRIAAFQGDPAQLSNTAHTLQPTRRFGHSAPTLTGPREPSCSRAESEQRPEQRNVVCGSRACSISATPLPMHRRGAVVDPHPEGIAER